MQTMCRFLSIMALVGLVAGFGVGRVRAQAPVDEPGRFEANRTRVADTGSKVFPHGNGEPGSMLVYLVDFGARTLTAANRPTNFLSVTNLHSKQAVTIYVSYLSAQTCSEVLGFLLVLTPNDSWQFDPFNLAIPRPDGLSTGVRASAFLLDASSASAYGDGRFLILISASGAYDPSPSSFQPLFPDGSRRQTANVLFPNSIYQRDNDIGGSNPLPGFLGVGAGLGGQRGANRVLNTLTAKHISFNYLVGSQTLATPPLPDGTRRAFGSAAWARPAVVFDRLTQSDATFGLGDGNGTIKFLNISYDRDGDGPAADFRVILAGQEDLPDVANQTIITNDNFLRSEIQNGFYSPFLKASLVAGTVSVRVGWQVKGGALVWDRVFPTDEAELLGASPDKQVLNLISLEDDYNGSRTSGVGPLDQRLAGFWPAHTLLATAVYDNAESPLSQVVPEILVFPPPAILPIDRLAVVCISAFQSDESFTLGTNFGDLTLRDFYQLAPFGSLRSVSQHLAGPVPDPPQASTDLSAGWMRFNRLRQELADGTAFVSESPSINCGTRDCTVMSSALGTTPPFIVTADRSNQNPRQHSFLLLGRYSIQFRELGVAYWMHQGSDEDTGIEK
ncbi:MAG: hypothetical protein HY644_01195 [Acidobacteria bacterium]|nr:hypothetical protein [Acidobacteriota bacterium]